MRISSLRLTNFRGFKDSGYLTFGSRANLFVGPNNSGKSSIIRAIGLLQEGLGPTVEDIRTGLRSAEVEVGLTDLGEQDPVRLPPEGLEPIDPAEARALISLSRSNGGLSLDFQSRDSKGELRGNVNRARQVEPDHLLVPYLSRRKAVRFEETINIGTQTSVDSDLRFLAAKVDRLVSPHDPRHEMYEAACKEILGFQVGTWASANGKRAGIIVGEDAFIPMDALGEGVSNLVGLIVNLCVSREKIFLIEEPENDIHPQALKALLRFMIERTEHNQMFVSTHSNIVLRYLGGLEESAVYRVDLDWDGGIPESVAEQVPNDPHARQALLEELGYELIDAGLWAAWLLLEESSAERLIREYLIPWFSPALIGRVRTMASGGVSKLEPKFEDFDRLFLFTHLTPVYKNRAWVIADGDEQGRGVIDALRERYEPAGWDPSRFRNWTRSDFEMYYPERFFKDVSKALSVPDREARRTAKSQLLDTVLEWIETDQDAARQEFSESAADVVQLLREIEASLSA